MQYIFIHKSLKSCRLQMYRKSKNILVLFNESQYLCSRFEHTQKIQNTEYKIRSKPDLYSVFCILECMKKGAPFGTPGLVLVSKDCCFYICVVFRFEESCLRCEAIADASISDAALRPTACNGNFYLRLTAGSPHGVVLERNSFVCLYNASPSGIVQLFCNF